jgi:hypothetical protein
LSDFIKVLDRLKVLKGVSKDREIAELLVVKADTLSQWKNRNKIPFEVINNFCNLQNVSLNWVYFGKGDIYLNEQKSENVNKNFSNSRIITGDNSNIHGDNHVNINNGTPVKEEPKAVQKSADIEEMCAMMVQYAPKEYVAQVRGKLEAFRQLVLD